MKKLKISSISGFSAAACCIMLVMSAASCGDNGGTDDVIDDMPGDDTITCPPGFTACGANCVDLNTDNSNCGACYVMCPAGYTCQTGTCAVGCDAGFEMCADGCKDTVNDPFNCGLCGNICPAGLNGNAVCEWGACELECNFGFWDIDGTPGCEYACAFTSAAEQCNGIDDNCNGYAEEGFQCAMSSTVSCETSCGSLGTGLCGISCMLPTGADCIAPLETCNSMDDNCDDLIDEGFACQLGTVVDCTTTCSTTGSGLCQPSCILPAAEACTPPAETCNGTDDDCDTVPDNGYDCQMGAAGACTTRCGTEGTRTCMDDCRFDQCCSVEEVCFNGCDDDCDTLTDEDCGPAPPTNDLCTGATNASIGGIFRGDTTYANDNTTGCSGSGGADVYFYFDLTVTSDVFINTYDTAYNTVLYVSSTCGGTDRGCNDDGQTAQSELHLRSVPPGRYYVALDGFSSADIGAYGMEIYMTPDASPGERCGDPILIEGVVASNSDSYTQDATGSCGGSGKDVVYYFVLPAAGTVSFSTCTSITAFDTLLYIRDKCNNGSTEVGCSDDVPGCMFDSNLSTVEVTLDAGIYYLFLDGWGTESGAYRIETSGL